MCIANWDVTDVATITTTLNASRGLLTVNTTAVEVNDNMASGGPRDSVGVSIVSMLWEICKEDKQDLNSKYLMKTVKKAKLSHYTPGQVLRAPGG
jgi:hypothetical protein